MILTFEDGEDEILNHILSYVSTETKVFQSFVSVKKNLIFLGVGNRYHKTIGEKATGRNHFNIYRI